MCEVSRDVLFSNEHCQKILKKYTQEQFTLLDSEVKKFSESVLGFLSEHLVLIIKYKTKNTDRIRRAKFFVKGLPPSNSFHSNYIKEMEIFNKEAKIFKNLLQPFSSLSTRSFAPKCFLTQEDKFIVLEDLSNQGYRISNSTYLTLEHMVSLMKTIACFHAASIIYEENKSNVDGEYRLSNYFQEELKECTFSFIKGHPRNKWCINVEKCISECIKLQTRYENNETRHENLRNIIFRRMPEFIRPSKIFRNVVNHDDLWSNNIMFDSDLKCVIVDFQLARYVPPAYDVLMALYLNTRRDFLENNFHVLLNTYYEALSEELRAHQINIDNIYSRQQFSDSIDEYQLPALVESVMYGTIIYIPQELSDKIIADVEVFNDFMFENRSKYVAQEYVQNETFRNRFNNVLYPLIEFLDKYNE